MFVKSGGTKGVLLCLCLTAVLLAGCGGSSSRGAEPSDNLGAESPETAVSETSSEEGMLETPKSEAEETQASQDKEKETPVSQDKGEEMSAVQDKAEETSAVQDKTKENSAVQTEGAENQRSSKIIYEGRYFDEKWYNYVDMPAEESPLVYCEIIISNVTDTSFDFVINEEVMATGEVTPVISAGTATIEDAGAKAVYEGDGLTLTFLFPDDQNTFPQHLEISGSEKLENNVYMNNSIPGHESG